MSNAQQMKERAKQFATRALQSVEVPQWGGKVFYRTPNLSTIKAANAEAQGDSFEFNARIVVACGLDEDGKPIWNKAEYKDLMVEYDPAAVVFVANAIMADAKDLGTSKQLADDEKN